MSLFVAACATGPTLQESQASVSPLSPEHGRVFFYRTNSGFGAAIQPSVMLDGIGVGDAVPNGVFYCDVAPGKHFATVSTEVDRTVAFNVEADQTAYIKMDWGFGYIMARVQIEQVSPDIGVGEAAVSSLIKSNCFHS
jgi:uncharacterized protein DUF2846